MSINKRKQDNLQQLINTLSPAEKRSFKLFTNIQVGDKKYLELFDCLEKNPGADSKMLTRRTKLTPARLAGNKHYLNQMLLRSLRNNDDALNKGQHQLKTIIDATNLFERGMYSSALSVIDKGVEDAYHFEKHSVISGLLGIKSFILGIQGSLDELNACNAERKRASQAYEEYFDFYSLCVTVQKLQGERKNKGELEAILRHPLLKKKPEALQSIKAGSCWFNVYQMVYDGLGDNDKLLAISQQMVAFYQANTRLLDIDARAYILAYISLAQVECFAGNYKKALNSLNLMQPILHTPPQYLSAENIEKINFYIRHTRAHVTLALHQYVESAELGKELYRVKDTLSPVEKYTSLHEYALALLHVGQNKDAYDKLEELLLMGDNLRADLHLYVRPLIILTQLALNNFSVVPYRIKSTKAWMKRQKIKNEGLDIFFHHAYAIAKAKDKAERLGAWGNLNTSVQQGKVDALNLHMRSLKNWLSNRIAA